MTINEQVRKQRIRQALDALPPDGETLRVPWRGKQERIPVIRIELECTVLNPRSHRIKAQLESAPSAATIAADPDSAEAQEAIRELLRATPGFEALRQNIADEGQKEPGIVTREGRLINANTRAVALADTGVDYIDVAVLPPDATVGEIYDLELDLQVAQDYRQEYSFTNELLFVEDLITEQNRGEKDVAIRLRWATPTKASSLKTGIAKVQRYVRHLDLIRDIQASSGGRIPLTDFDDAEQVLQEWDTAYQALRDKDPAAAEQLKHARTLGLMVDLGYERQRMVDAGWVESHLAEAFAEEPLLRELVEASQGDRPDGHEAVEDDSGLADFEGFDDSGEGDSEMHGVVRDLVRRLGASAGAETVLLPTPEGEKEVDRESLKAAVNSAMRAAAEDAKNAAKAGSELKLPKHLVTEATKRLASARKAYIVVASRSDFDRTEVLQGVEQATRALDALRLELGE